MEKYNFKDKTLQKIYEDKISQLKTIADKTEDNPAYLWDETVRRYAMSIEKAKKLLLTDDMQKYITTGMIKNLDIFLDKCSNAEFHIALVGAIKAGKSTLINALLGYEYASTKVTPETASLTKFKKTEEDAVKVSFYTEDEWEKLWKSAQEAKAAVFLEEYKTLGAESEKSRWLDARP